MVVGDCIVWESRVLFPRGEVPRQKAWQPSLVILLQILPSSSRSQLCLAGGELSFYKSIGSQRGVPLRTLSGSATEKSSCLSLREKSKPRWLCGYRPRERRTL